MAATRDGYDIFLPHIPLPKSKIPDSGINERLADR
jgi:hypothetical protein